MHQPNLTTVIIFRRSYGRRYTDLPVEQVDRDGFVISCEGTHMRPPHYDLRSGDIVRWREGDRYLEATISAVHVADPGLHVALRDAYLLPAEFFPY
ncbi:MAG: hypothetical protein AB4911_01310 [Oscillochloridaceae bacterium umkhey_bin13]